MDLRQPVRHKRVEHCVTICYILQHRCTICPKKDRSTVIPNSRFIILSSLTETLAADSSNRGLVIFFKETILDLDIKKVQ